MKIETSKRITLAILVILVSFFILVPMVSLAAGLVPCGLSENNPDTSWDDTVDCDLCGFLWLIKNIMDLIFKLGGTICFLVVVVGAIIFLVAGGSANLLATGKKIFLSAVIGLVIILSSWLIVSAILGATGYNAADNWYKFECEIPAPPVPTHLACQNGYCEDVEGEGEDTCQSDDECGHSICQNETCVRLETPGTSECSSNTDCQPIWTCGSTSQRYANCLSKPECEEVCENVSWATCFDDSQYCQGGGIIYECLQTDNCLNLGLLNYADSFCGGPCSSGSRCCGGSQEEIGQAKCNLQCYPLLGNYDPQTGQCTCVPPSEYHLECKRETVYAPSPDTLSTFTCQRVEGSDPNPSENSCTTKNEGESCIPPEGTPCPSGEDRECSLGQICESNVCVNGCREDPDCPANQICESGSCQDGCRACQAEQKPVCYKRYDRCLDPDNCTGSEIKCCGNCVCKCGNWWECLSGDDYCYPSEEAQCGDGDDNDGDGYADQDDRACHQDNDITKPYHAEYDNESAARTTQCSDGQDNDGDGKTDYPSDPGCTSVDGESEEGEDPFDGYTLQVDERQKDHASQALMDLLACIKDKIPEEARIISSISDDGILSGECDYLNCSGNVCGGCSGCAHTCNSCHYGGRNCNTQQRFSYAVDFAKEEYCDEIKTAALECNAGAFVNYEGGEGAHVHVSIGKVSGCGCDTGVGKPCP